jgi:high-affinity nickel permease
VFGLDSAIMSFSDGTKLLVIVGVSILLGLRHATDPDHLAAVTTLVASREKPTRRAAATLGGCWSLGHASTLFLCGIPIVLFKAYLPEPVQQGAETAVGLIIVSLAGGLLVRWRRGLVHAHVHEHDGRQHVHFHTHAATSVHAHERPIRVRSPLQAYAIGLIHGIGGSAGVGLLLLASIHSHSYALIGLTLFALFTAVSMTLISSLLGMTIANASVARSLGRIAPALAIASLLFGLWYAFSALQLVS